MKNRVYNSTFGKIGRTLGFLFILFSSVVIVTKLIIMNQTYEGVSALLPIAEEIDSILATLPVVINEYISVMFFVGFIFLIWAIRKGIILRVLLTVLLLFILGSTLIGSSGLLTPVILTYPEWSQDILLKLLDVYLKIMDISEYIIGGAAAAIPLLIWYVCAKKKPGRISLFVIRVAATFLFLAVAMLIVAIEFATAMLTNELYMQITMSLYILAFLLLTVGSLLGVLGFFKK